MPELTLEALAKRIEEIERKLAGHDRRKPDWRRSVGMFGDSEFMKQVDEEGRKIRAASTDPELEDILRELPDATGAGQ